MESLFDQPAIQGGVAPFVVALAVAAAFARTRFAWLAIVAGYATMVALSTGFSFSPLTVARKTLLLGLLAPLVGVALDLAARATHALPAAIAIAAGAVSFWVFLSILQQRETTSALAVGGGIALFVAALVGAVLRLRADGLRAGAAGLGLGLAVGIAGVLSASIGALGAGVALAAASGAMLLVQVGGTRPLAPGFTGALTIGLLGAYIPAGTLLLAELPWYALPLLLVVPAAVLLPVPERASHIGRAALLAGYALAAAALPILAAWYAARGSLT
jgi:hypothetical protein